MLDGQQRARRSQLSGRRSMDGRVIVIRSDLLAVLFCCILRRARGPGVGDIDWLLYRTGRPQLVRSPQQVYFGEEENRDRRRGKAGARESERERERERAGEGEKGEISYIDDVNGRDGRDSKDQRQEIRFSWFLRTGKRAQRRSRQQKQQRQRGRA